MAELARMWLASARLHAEHDPEFYGLADDPEREMRGYWEGVLNDPSRRAFVAELAGGDIAGCIQADLRTVRIFARSQRGYLSNIWVNPDHRRLGLGRALVAAACVWLRDRGAQLVILNVGAHNRQALAFYRALGYRAANLNLVVRLSP